MELLIPVEVAASRIAAPRRTYHDLKLIHRAPIGMEHAIDSDALGDHEDCAFHEAIVNATHNPPSRALCTHLEFGARSIIRRARANTRANLPDMPGAVQEEDRAIFQAIKAGDPAEATHPARQHLLNAAGRINIYLQDGRDAGAEGGGDTPAL